MAEPIVQSAPAKASVRTGVSQPNPDALKSHELYLADLGRIGGRHETARAFYMTINAALLTLLGIAVKDAVFHSYTDIIRLGSAVAGAIICLLWLLHMASFRALFAAKADIIRALEEHLAFAPFTAEAAHPRMTARWGLTSLDQLAAGAMGLAFLGLCLVAYLT